MTTLWRTEDAEGDVATLYPSPDGAPHGVVAILHTDAAQGGVYLDRRTARSLSDALLSTLADQHAAPSCGPVPMDELDDVQQRIAAVRAHLDEHTVVVKDVLREVALVVEQLSGRLAQHLGGRS